MKHAYLLENVLDLPNCCKGIFLHQGNNFSVIHNIFYIWSSGPFVVPMLIAAFFIFKNVVLRIVYLAEPIFL